MKLSRLLFYLLLLVMHQSSAQLTKVSGKILDATTLEPMPFVSVSFGKTGVGTSSDIEGQFQLQTDRQADSIMVSYTGYIRKSLAVKNGTSTAGLVILMDASTTNLMEVVIKPGENPAHAILRKVIAAKPLNNREKIDYYQYEVYNKVEFDVNNINKKLKKSRLLKPFNFVFENIDSSNTTEKPSLPLFLSESISEVFYRKQPKVTKEIIKASKVAGIRDNKSVSQFSGDLYQNVNIYDNNLLVFGKTFVSPISDNGLFYYRYYLIDSLFIGKHRCYQIQFKPKRKQELLFSGNMWINDSTFAVRRLEMSMAGDANINFIKTFYVVQDYTNVDGTWMIEKDRLVVDFQLQKSQPGFYGRKSTSYKNFVLNKPQEEKFYSKANNLIVEGSAENQNEDFWRNNRHDTLSEKERNIYRLVDTIQTLKAYKTWYDLVQMGVTGYKIFGKVEFGEIYKLLSFNRVEGYRLRFGGRTSNKFSNWHEFSGYLAYGTLDQRFKYAGGYRAFLSKDPRQMIFMNYKSDYEILGQSQNAFSQDNVIASVFRRNPLNSLTRVDQYSAAFSHEWVQGIESRLSLVNRKIIPLNGLTYRFKTAEGTILEQSRIITSEIRFSQRIAVGERFVAGEFDRVSAGTLRPVFTINYAAGLKGVFSSDYQYHRISLGITDRIRLNPIGYIDIAADYGKIFGSVPYPLMELHGGNETYYYDPYAFNMMNYFEFASDQFVMLSGYHHFDGFFLNKIPLMRKLKWREVATAKMLFGGVSAKNRELLIFPPNLFTLSPYKPYAEAGVGVENIFKILRFDIIWRLTYRDNPNISNFGLRGTLQFIF
jgi:hypothetical protein